MAIARLLPHVYLSEFDEDGHLEFKMRLKGTELDEQAFNIGGEHMQSLTEEQWGRVYRSFNNICEYPCALEADWRFFTADNKVFDCAASCLPLYGKTKQKKFAIGVMILKQNHSEEILGLCDGRERAEVLHGMYADIGFGKPNLETEVNGRPAL